MGSPNNSWHRARNPDFLMHSHGSILGPFGPILGTVWPFGASLRPPGSCRRPPGGSWELLGPSRGPLGLPKSRQKSIPVEGCPFIVNLSISLELRRPRIARQLASFASQLASPASLASRLRFARAPPSADAQLVILNPLSPLPLSPSLLLSESVRID